MVSILLYHCATYSQKEKFPKSHDPNGLIERTLAEMLPYSRNQTALHLAVDKRCYASASALLKAGGYQLKPDEDSFTPDLESLFNFFETTKITDRHVRGLLMKTKMKIRTPQELHKNHLSQEDQDGQTLFSRLNLSLTTWSEVVRLPTKGLKFSIVNNKVPEALLAWFKAESDGKATKEESAKVRNLLEGGAAV